VTWPQLVGYARARCYLLTGEPDHGIGAADLGLITGAVPGVDLDETGLKVG
jgi:enoyl-CoA hydratase